MVIVDHSLDVGGHQRVETQLLHRNHELGELALVGLDHVGVGAADLLQLVLQLSDDVVLAVLDLLDGLADGPDGAAVDVCGLEHLVELQVLDLQLLGDRADLLLEDEVAESLALLDGVDGVVEDFEELLALLLLVLVGLHLDLVLVLEVSELLLLAVYFCLDLCLLLDDLLLLQQVLAVLLDLQFEQFVGLNELLPFLLNLGEQPLVLILLLVEFFDLVFELLDEV